MTATPPPPATDRSTSPLAIVGLVLAFLLPLVGAIISFIAIGQTGAGKRGGRGIAVAGAIIGTLFTLISIGVAILVVVAAGAAVDEANDTAAELNELAEDFEQDLATSFQDKAAVDAGEIPDFSSDIVVGALTSDDFSSSIEVTVTNSGEETYTYTATVAAVSPDGATQYDTAVVVADSLAPGQSATQDGTFFTEIPADATFELVDYSRSSF